MGDAGGQGLQVRTGIDTDPEVATQSYRVEEQPSNNKRSTSVAGEGCNTNGHPLPESVFQQDIWCPKEGWVSQTYNQPEITEPVYDGDTWRAWPQWETYQGRAIGWLW